MRYLAILLLLAGCGSDMEARGEEGVFIVSGQSNAMRCDWDYVTQETGYEIYNIAKPGTAIQQHIDEYYHPEINGMDVLAVIFVNGGADAKIETPPDEYIDKHFPASPEAAFESGPSGGMGEVAPGVSEDDGKVQAIVQSAYTKTGKVSVPKLRTLIEQGNAGDPIAQQAVKQIYAAQQSEVM